MPPTYDLRDIEFTESDKITTSSAAFGHSFANIATSTTTTLKTGAGVLHTITVWNGGATAPSITVYNNTAGSGAIIGTFTPPAIGTFTLNVAFTIGLTIVTAGTTPVNVTVSYR